MKYRIGLLKGDGIGPEIVDSAVSVLEAVGELCGHEFVFTPYDIGGAAIDKHGEPLPAATVEGCLNSDSVLLGAVGGPKWDTLPGNMRPEKALLGIRAAMGLFTNLRPAKLYPALKGECPLREDIVEKGFDIMIVRELTGGIYFGERGMREGKYGEEAYDTEAYSRMEIERIALHNGPTLGPLRPRWDLHQLWAYRSDLGSSNGLPCHSTHRSAATVGWGQTRPLTIEHWGCGRRS